MASSSTQASMPAVKSINGMPSHQLENSDRQIRAELESRRQLSKTKNIEPQPSAIEEMVASTSQITQDEINTTNVPFTKSRETYSSIQEVQIDNNKELRCTKRAKKQIKSRQLNSSTRCRQLKRKVNKKHLQSRSDQNLQKNIHFKLRRKHFNITSGMQKNYGSFKKESNKKKTDVGSSESKTSIHYLPPSCSTQSYENSCDRYCCNIDNLRNGNSPCCCSGEIVSKCCKDFSSPVFLCTSECCESPCLPDCPGYSPNSCIECPCDCSSPCTSECDMNMNSSDCSICNEPPSIEEEI